MFKVKKRHLFTFVICFSLLVFMFSALSNYQIVVKADSKLNILILHDGRGSHIIQSFQIDKDDFNITLSSNTELINKTDPNIDIVIIFDVNLSNNEQKVVSNFVNNGGSIIIFMGQKLHKNGTLLGTLNILNISLYEANKAINTEQMLFKIRDSNQLISKNIDWNSAPEMKTGNMTVISDEMLNSTTKPIIDVYPVSKNLQIEIYKRPILLEKKDGNGTILLFTGWLEDDANIDFKMWPYFNYFMYALAFESVGKTFSSFAQWPYSPVPHVFDQIIIGIIVFILAVLAIVLFIIIRRKSRSKMDQATIDALKALAEEEERRKLEEAKKLEEQLKEKEKVDLKNDWEVIGTHRQLGGFLFTLFIGLFLVIPQLLISNFVMPQIIQPYPQAAGWYYYAYNFFQIAWLLFDFGSSYALAKYFAQYRVKNPEKAIHYIQIFVWWQMFTGIAQITIFGFIGSIIFPMTNLAHMSWIFVIYSFVQYPGFFLVFMYTFQGLQRSDLHLITYVAWEVIWLLVGQVIFCYLGREIGAANPVIGEALGAGIGYAIARFFDYWATFFMSLILFKKLGYSPKTCFRVDFVKDELKEVLKYGSKLAFGESFVQLGWFIQIIITSAFVANYSNELGWFNLVWNIGLIVQIVTLYGQSLLGAFSESSSHGKENLTKLYVYQAFRWGNYFAYFLISVLFATGAKFIVGAAGYEYGGPAVKFLVPLLIFHTAGVYSWLGDAVFEGTGHTGYAAIVWIIEQTIRAILMLVFVLIFKNMVWVIIAYIPAVTIKDIIVWLIVYKKIVKYKVYPFKAFLTPALSAVVNYISLYFVSEFIWNIPMGDKIINTAILFMIGIFLFIFFYAFMDGLFGGYDDNTLEEFRRAANLVTTPFIRIFPRLMVKCAELGCKLSPFHNKFKIDIYEIAMKEAYDLTLEKRALKI
ncbi:MAG: lipopolysaccharide biosynthesis protein [Candidatus Helarchaeota archaeon]